MKVKSFSLKITALLITLFSIFFFAGLYMTGNGANAVIQGISGNQFILTASIGNTTGHYFRDNANNSTLSNADSSDEGGEYYSIVPSSGLLLGKTSSGYGSVITTSDMNALIEKGVLYARAEFSFKANNDNAQSNIEVALSQGDNSQTITTSYNNGQSTAYSTELLKLSADEGSEIRFSFTTLSSTSVGSYSSFILSKPTIKFYTKINSLDFSNQDQIVSAGGIIELNATNDILQINNTTGNLLSYSKINHDIEYKFIAGSEYAKIVGDYLHIDSDAPEGAEIVLQAKCRENSYDNTYIASEGVTFTVSYSQVEVNVKTDFDNPPTITGEGVYTQGRRIFLRIDTNKSSNSRFNFEGWYVNDILQSTQATLNYVVNAGDEIYAKLTKDITIDSIEVADKIYDGTTNIDSKSITYHFNGVEEGHEVSLGGIEIAFANASAGQDKAVSITGMENMTLTGTNASLYVLTSRTAPSATGNIIKRDVTLTPTTLSKYYGDREPTLAYDAKGLVDGQTLYGSLLREVGEEVGEYLISLGSIATDTRNSNYNISMAEGEFYFKIEKRPLTISNLFVEDKVYDKTTNAVLSDYSVSNIVGNEDVTVEIIGQYEDCNAGYGKTVNITASVQGQDNENYILPELEALTGNIIQKSIIVKANDATVVFGDELDLTYSVEGLLEGDFLQGELQIEDLNVGLHTITLGNLSNENYSITYQSANCQITPRDVYITAVAKTKQYGDVDPALTFTIENAVEGQVLNGNLTREAGEELGSYQIGQGTLSNSNYTIHFTCASFEILQRDITVQFSFSDKTYDGTTNVSYQANFINALSSDDFSIEIDAALKSKDAGQVSVIIEGQPKVKLSEQRVNLGDKLSNYNFTFEQLNDIVQIEKKPVNIVIESLSKTYGDQDPEISYQAEGVVEGETLTGKPKRNAGESVGEYLIYLDELNNQNNPNYIITYLSSEAVLTVLPREIQIVMDNLSKFYGDADPEFSFTLQGALQFDDTIEDLFDGQIVRQSGEIVGIYLLSIDGVTNENYNIVFQNANFVINKRPITVIADDATKIYGDEDPSFTYTATNLVDGESITLSVKRQYGENVGDYAMVLESSNDARYSITFVPGILTILPSEITLRAEDKVKVYGDEDPSYSVIIVDGLLKNNDVLANIANGQMERTAGENVGQYVISQGSYNLGDNYKIKFQTGSLEIVQQSITVSANQTNKQYGDADPVIGYTITSGSLKFSDDFVGALTRQPGETLGSYTIEQGSLSLSENYILEFVSNDFVIEKRQITIIPSVSSKIYGETEPELTYQIVVGSLVNGEKLEGEIYRDKPTTAADPHLYENVGSYRIYSTLNHENYEITFGTHYFEVEPRVIEIRAENASKVYGQEDPELVYTIINEEDILSGDVLQGSISRVSGENAGNYDIRSSLTLGRNYTINFTRGIFTILPIELVVRTENYVKTYGQMDPVFTYQIVEGELINSDILYGSITREQGEDAGVYKMLSSLSNINYNITLEEAYLVIEKKDVYMLASVYDKIYDGTDVAQIKTPVVSGLVDKDVSLYYDRNNCARFATSQVGDNIPVSFHDIVLVGDKAGNYNLILPTDVTGSITYKEVISENEEVIIEALDSAVLYQGTMLNVNNFEIAREDMGLNKYQVITGFAIRLERDGQNVDLNGTISLTIKLDSAFADRNNIYVYHKTESGQYVLVNSENEDGLIKINIDELGEFVLMTDNDAWIDVVAYVCIGVLGLFAICYVIYLVRNRKNKKNFDEKKSS